MHLDCDRAILAIGHSARDTFAMLLESGVPMEPKAFSMGVRIEHRQSWLDRRQYGDAAGHPSLPPADYKLAAHLPDGNSAYTFCMCPGGQVVASSSEAGGVVTNGMSKRRPGRGELQRRRPGDAAPGGFPVFRHPGRYGVAETAGTAVL